VEALKKNSYENYLEALRNNSSNHLEITLEDIMPIDETFVIVFLKNIFYSFFF